MIDDDVLYMITVYDHPTDYPQHFVARRWACSKEGGRPLPGVYKADTLDELRALLPAGLLRMERDPNDDANIVETWI